MATELISLKLKKTTSSDTANKTLKRFLKLKGVLKIERLFPETDELEFTTFYIVTVESSSASSMLKQLSADPSVEFAHIPPSRKPAGGVRNEQI